jgi:hypothetical protein
MGTSANELRNPSHCISNSRIHAAYNREFKQIRACFSLSPAVKANAIIAGIDLASIPEDLLWIFLLRPVRRTQAHR